jgi:hypothetical protein
MTLPSTSFTEQIRNKHVLIVLLVFSDNTPLTFDKYRHSPSASPDYVCERNGQVKIVSEDLQIAF